MKPGYTYIVGNHQRSVFYIGVTNDLERRISEHKKAKIANLAKNIAANICFITNHSKIFLTQLREKNS